MTAADTAAVVAAIAAAVSAVLTLVIAGANYVTARTEAKATDFDSCLTVVTKITEAQRRVHYADSEMKLYEFRDLLNLMEALAQLENDNKTSPSTRKFTGHYLEETWAYMQVDQSYQELLANSRTGAETFAELRRFAERRAKRVEHLTSAYQRLRTKIAPHPEGDISSNGRKNLAP